MHTNRQVLWVCCLSGWGCSRRDPSPCMLNLFCISKPCLHHAFGIGWMLYLSLGYFIIYPKRCSQKTVGKVRPMLRGYSGAFSPLLLDFLRVERGGCSLMASSIGFSHVIGRDGSRFCCLDLLSLEGRQRRRLTCWGVTKPCKWDIGIGMFDKNDKIFRLTMRRCSFFGLPRS